MAYVLKNNAGAYAETPQQVTQLVSQWLEPDNPALQIMSKNAAKLARPDASLSIAGEICGLIPAGRPIHAKYISPAKHRLPNRLRFTNRYSGLSLRRRS